MERNTKSNTFTILVLVFIFYLTLSNGQDFVFPSEDDVQVSHKTKPLKKDENRPRPILNATICPGNQLYYPGETKNDPWFCDCGPRFIYYPAKDDCFLIYRKGPCRQGQHLILRNRKVQCAPNPCKEGFIKYTGQCYEIGKSSGPCKRNFVLQVNQTTLKVECLPDNADALTIFQFPDNCPPGSKRDKTNKCRENWNV